MPVCYCKSLNKISWKTQPEENAIEHSKILVTLSLRVKWEETQSLHNINFPIERARKVLVSAFIPIQKYISLYCLLSRCSPWLTEMGRDLLLATFRFSELWPGLPVSVSTSSAPGTACSAKCETRQISANMIYIIWSERESEWIMKDCFLFGVLFSCFVFPLTA